MNRKNRFVIAIALTLVLVLIAAGTWAAPKFQGTVPSVPQQVPLLPSVGGECLEQVDMGTAIFMRQVTGCIILVELVEDPTVEYVPAPQGMAFIGDTFKVTADSKETIIQVCYAYPPEFESKSAKIYRLNDEVTPNAWVEVPGPVIANGTICVTSIEGVFSLIGNP